MNLDEAILISKRVDETSEIPVLTQVLRIATYDEFHAYEVYKKVVETHGNITPFTNIVEAEVNHINAMVALCNKYNVEVPINYWGEKITECPSILECCQLGVEAELENIAMYDALIDFSPADDITDILFQLQAASYNNHLPAFQTCVEQINALNNGGTAEPQNSGTNPHHHDIYNLVEKALGGDLKSMIPANLQGLLGGLNKELMLGAVLGAGAIYLLDEMKNKEEKNEEE